MADDVHTAVKHVQRILDGLLLLARSQAGIGARESADLAGIAAAALDAARERTRDLAIDTDLRPAPVSGEPVLLERMIGNLVDNAVRYNQPDGQLALSTSTADGRAVLRISNTGPEIPPDKAQTLLEPFVHGQATRIRTDGLGLGLSIVRAIALAHQGRIAITAQPGGGLDITVELPQHPRATSGPASPITRGRRRGDP
jgi:signal transduction histidine kinase